MRRWWIAAAACAAAAVVLLPSAPASRVPLVPASQGRAKVIAVADVAGLHGAWRDWLVWVSAGESGWSSAANNDSPSEAKRSADALARLVGEGRWPCANDPAQYAIGSGGWYGQMAPYTVVNLRDNGAPKSVYCDVRNAWRDPLASTLAHLDQARGSAAYVHALPAKFRTFLHLRAIYGLPSRRFEPQLIDNPKRRAGYSETLTSIGIPSSFLDAPVPAPSSLDAAIATLAALVAGGVPGPEGGA